MKTLPEASHYKIADGVVTILQPGAELCVQENKQAGRVSITELVLPPADTYRAGDELSFTIRYSEAVFVQFGVPRLKILIAGKRRFAAYASGSGTSDLVFTYTLSPQDVLRVTDKLEVQSVVEDSSNIEGAGRKYVSHDFPDQTLEGLRVNPSVPRLVGVAPVENRLYRSGESVTLRARFSAPVDVVGRPALVIAGDLRASYVQGSGTAEIDFALAVPPATSLRRLELTGEIDTTYGAIETEQLDSLATGFRPTAISLSIDTQAPRLREVVALRASTHQVSERVGVVFRFDEPVLVTGTPKVDVVLEAGRATAEFAKRLSATELLFEFVVSEGLLANGTIDVGGALVDGAIVDRAENALTAVDTTSVKGIRIDAVAPRLVDVVYPAQTFFAQGEELQVELVVNEPVRVSGAPALRLRVGDAERTAVFREVKDGNRVVFGYAINRQDQLTDAPVAVLELVTPGPRSEIRDLSKVPLVASEFPQKGYVASLDGNVPYVVSARLASGLRLKRGDQLLVDVTFSEPVTVTGAPVLPFTAAGATLEGAFSTAVSEKTLRFSFSPPAEFKSGEVVAVSPIDLRGGAIRSTIGSPSKLSFRRLSLGSIRADFSSPQLERIVYPRKKTFRAGDALNVTLVFSEPISVAEKVELATNLGPEAKLRLSARPSNRELVFRSVLPGNINSARGALRLTDLPESLASVKDTFGNPLEPSDVAQAHELEIDTQVPALTAVEVVERPFYRFADEIQLRLTFSEPMAVSGVPSVRLKFADGARLARYQAGTGTSTLEFTYKVKATDLSLGGFTPTTIVRSEAATLTDVAGNLFGSELPPQLAVATPIDGRTPGIKKISYPTNKTYRLGEEMKFRIQFDAPVKLLAPVELKFQLGTTTRSVAGVLDPETGSELTFSYVTQAGDSGTGLKLIAPLAIGPGALVNDFGVTASGDFAAARRPLVVVDADQPRLLSITGPRPGNYKLGDRIDLQLNFSEPVAWDPKARLETNLPSRALQFESGKKATKVRYSYTVVPGDENIGADFRVTLPAELASTVVDESGNGLLLETSDYDFTDVQIDGNPPQVEDVSIGSQAIYRIDDEIVLTLRVSEPVTAKDGSALKLLLGSGPVLAPLVSGSGTQELVFRYKVQHTDHDEDGVRTLTDINLAPSTLADVAGNKIAPVPGVDRNLDVLIVGNEAVIASVDPVRRGVFRYADHFDVDVRFNKEIVLKGDKPQLRLDLAGRTVLAKLLSQIRPDTLRFRYSVEPKTNSNGDVLAVSPLVVPGAITDTLGLKAITSFSTYAIKDVVIDTGAPRVTSVALPEAGEYSSGDELRFKVSFSEAVVVDGAPEIPLLLKSGRTMARYLLGSGTSELFFVYRVQDGDFEQTSFAVESPIRVAGIGSIRDAAGNSANATFERVVDGKIKVVGSMPNVVSVVTPKSQTYGNGDRLEFAVAFSGKVYVSGTPELILDVGGKARAARYVEGSGADVLRFAYDVKPNDRDPDGITLTSPIQVEGAAIKSIYGMSVKRKFEQPDTRGILVDTSAPRITGFRSLVANYLRPKDVFVFALTFDKVVTVTGVPRIAVGLANQRSFATYRSGSGSKELLFSYLVAPGDTSSGGLEVISPVLVDGARISDERGNLADPSFTSFRAQDVVIDSAPPTIQSIAVDKARTYEEGDEILIKLKVSEPVHVLGEPRLPITLTSGSHFASYRAGSGTSELSFVYRVGLGDRDEDGILVELPLDLKNGEINDFSRNNLLISFSKYPMPDILIDTGDDIYLQQRLGTAAKPDAATKRYDLTGGSRFSNVEFFTNFTSVSLESVEREDNQGARLTSATNYAVGARWFKKWSQSWDSYIGLNVKRIEFEEATNRVIQNTENIYTKLSFGTNHYFRDNLKLLGEFSIDKRPYIYSKSVTELLIDPIGVYRFSFGANYAYKRFGPYQLGIQVLGDYFLPKQSDNLSLQSGMGFTSGAYIRQDLKKGYLRGEIFYEQAQQNSDISTQNYSEIGFGLTFNIPVGSIGF